MPASGVAVHIAPLNLPPARGHSRDVQANCSRLVCLAFVLSAAGAGCAGSGEGLDASGRPLGEGSPADDVFSRIQDTIFTPICTVCHAGASAPQGLRLDAGNSFAMLVGVPSVQAPSVLRVAPGNADASYLVQKIEGRAAVGGRMPLGGPPLPQASIDLVRGWIAAGAPPPTSLMSEPLVLRSSVPAADENAGHVDEVLLVFSQPIDASVAAAGVLRLRSESGDDVALQAIEVSLANPTVVRLAPAARLPAGRYVLSIRGTGPTALADVHAHTPGRDYDVAFSVTGTIE